MPKYSEGTWWDGFEAFAKEFFARIDEVDIHSICESNSKDKSGDIMIYLEDLRDEILGGEE